MKTKAPKATQAQMDERITFVAMELLDGKTRKDLLYLMKEWNLCERQIDICIERATEGIRELNKFEQEDNLAIVHSNLWELFRRAKGMNDFREAHAILNSIAKLKGLHEVKITKTIISKFDGVTDEDLDKILEDELSGAH